MSTNGFIDKTNISIFNTEYRDLNAWKLESSSFLEQMCRLFYLLVMGLKRVVAKIIFKILNFEEYVEDIFKETIIIM